MSIRILELGQNVLGAFCLLGQNVSYPFNIWQNDYELSVAWTDSHLAYLGGLRTDYILCRNRCACVFICFCGKNIWPNLVGSCNSLATSYAVPLTTWIKRKHTSGW